VILEGIAAILLFIMCAFFSLHYFYVAPRPQPKKYKKGWQRVFAVSLLVILHTWCGIWFGWLALKYGIIGIYAFALGNAPIDKADMPTWLCILSIVLFCLITAGTYYRIKQSKEFSKFWQRGNDLCTKSKYPSYF
jgi:hypothetical protein